MNGSKAMRKRRLPDVLMFTVSPTRIASKRNIAKRTRCKSPGAEFKLPACEVR